MTRGSGSGLTDGRFTRRSRYLAKFGVACGTLARAYSKLQFSRLTWQFRYVGEIGVYGGTGISGARRQRRTTVFENGLLEKFDQGALRKHNVSLVPVKHTWDIVRTGQRPVNC